jgi:large subunit ribosomal protein L6
VSRIGKMPVDLPQGVTVQVDGGFMRVKGPKGELSRKVPPDVQIKADNKHVVVERANNGRRARAMHGLGRALLQNLVTGVSKGFERVLEINGVGYRAEARQGILALSLGYSHPIEVMLPEGVSAKVEKNAITISGIDREQLGQLAAMIREQRPPEPYKGKGVKYRDEHIRRKVGKAGAS